MPTKKILTEAERRYLHGLCLAAVRQRKHVERVCSETLEQRAERQRIEARKFMEQPAVRQRYGLSGRQMIRK
jgi:hypothetical protein